MVERGGSWRTGALGLACVVLGAAALAEQRVWTGGGDGARFSDAANWQGGAAPSETGGDVLSFGAPAGGRLENDVANAAPWERLDVAAGAGDCTFAGLPLRVKGVTFNAGAGTTQTFDADLLFSGWNCAFEVPAGHVAVFNGNVAHAAASNCSFHLKGAGRKVVRGGMRMSVSEDTDNDANKFAPRLQGGTFLVEGDVDLPRYVIDGGAHIVVTNGATFRNWGKSMNSFIQTCTLDLCGGRLVNETYLIVAQSPDSTTRVNVYRNGLFDTGTTSFRPGNNGVAEFTVYDGGTFHWRQGPFSENGRTVLTVNGGRFVRGDDGSLEFGIGQRPANDTSYQNKGGNVVNLNGGELWAQRILNNSDTARNLGVATVVNFNGGTFMCTGSQPAYWGDSVDLLQANVQAGGIRIDTRGFDVGWNLSGAGEGGLVKLGEGTLTAAARWGFSGAVEVKAGVLAAADPGYVTQRVVLAPGAVFAPGGAARLEGLAGEDGVLRLVVSAEGPALTLAAAPEMEGTLFIELVDAEGAAWAEEGTFPLLQAPELDAAWAARCRVRAGAAGRTYACAVEEGVLKVSVAAGEGSEEGAVASTWKATAGGAWRDPANWSAGVPDGVGAQATFEAPGAGPVAVDGTVRVGAVVLSGDAPYVVEGDGTLAFASFGAAPSVTARKGRHVLAAPVTADAPLVVASEEGGSVSFAGDVSGVPEIRLVEGTVVSETPETLGKIVFEKNGVFAYEGPAATFAGEVRLEGNGEIRQQAGAGALTLAAAPRLMGPGTLALHGNGEEEIVLGGAGWITQPLDGRRLRLDGGLFRLASDLRLLWQSGGGVHIGSAASGRPTELVVADGAQAKMAGVEIGAAGETTGAPVQVRQEGGALALKNDLCLNLAAQTNDLVYLKTGGALTGDAWLCLYHAGATFRQTGGTTAFDGFAFGNRASASVNYTKWEKGGLGLVDIAGGAFSVARNWNWLGDAGGRRVDRVRLSGGTLTMPATMRAKAADRRNPASNATLELAGGTLVLGGAGETGQAGDYLAGLDYLSLAGEAAVDTAGQDATVSQPLVTTGAQTALTKRGGGTLALAATNDVPARVAVEAGTLAAAFRADAKADMPDGLLALWTFDGEDPLRDATGHGYDLEQAVPETPVAFTADEAHDGVSAWWQTGGGALKCTKIASAPLLRATVSLWVRLETKDYYRSHIGMFSMRCNPEATGNIVSFDLAYKKTINGAAMPECGIGNCVQGSSLTGIPKSKGGDISVKEWHMLTITREEGRVRGYVDGVPCTDVTLEARGGGALLEAGRMITLGANIANEAGFSEMMNEGGRLDDVAIYGRCLSDAEVAALYAARRRPSVAQEVRVAAGSVLDLRGGALTTDELAGAGTVTNGAVTARARLAVDPAAPLAVEAIALGKAGVVDCGRTAENPLPTRGKHVLVRAQAVTGEDPGAWTVVGTGVDATRASFRLSVDAANDLVLEAVSAGTVILLR